MRQIYKLQNEKIILIVLKFIIGTGVLRTVALRPTLLYGEGDSHLIPKILQLAKSRGNCLPRLSSTGGKQQITYVGELAQ